MLTFTKRLAIAASLLAVLASPAAGQPLRFWDHGVRITYVKRSVTDTQEVTATWGVATDTRFSATGYRVKVERVHPAIVFDVKQVTTISPVLAIKVPLQRFATDSIGLRVTVWASRNGVEGTDSVWGIRWFKRAPGTVGAPPPTSGLDTVNIFRFADGTIRPTIVSVDSSNPGAWTVTRSDPKYPMPLYVVRMSTLANLASATPQLIGAVAYAPSAPCTTPEHRDNVWAPDLGIIRMNPKVYPYPNAQPTDRNAFYPARMVFAMIAQLPVDSVAKLVKASMEQFIREDWPIISGLNMSYLRCYGPVPGLPPMDTIQPFTAPDGTLRPSLERVDSSGSSITVDRADAGYPERPARLHIQPVWANPSTDSATLLGADLVAPGEPCTGVVQYPSAVSKWWDASWSAIRSDPEALPYVAGQPNQQRLSLREAQAAAAQAPMDVLRRLSTRSRRAAAVADSASYPNGLTWYRECYGPP